MSSFHIWRGIIYADRYAGNICPHPDSTFIREGFIFFNNAMLNHKLHPLKKIMASKWKSPGAEPSCLQSRPVTKWKTDNNGTTNSSTCFHAFLCRHGLVVNKRYLRIVATASETTAESFLWALTLDFFICPVVTGTRTTVLPKQYVTKCSSPLRSVQQCFVYLFIFFVLLSVNHQPSGWFLSLAVEILLLPHQLNGPWN